MSEQPAQTVRDFESIPDLLAALDAKHRFEDIDLYYRDGSVALGELEAHIATLHSVEPEGILAYNTGMTFVTDALEVALHAADTDDPVVACASDTYNQTRKYVDVFIDGKRARVVYFDSGDFDGDDSTSVINTLEREQPDVVIAETIGNSANAPVLDIPRLLGWNRQSDHPATLVLDHTLPLETGFPLNKTLTPEDRVIGGISGTKSYIFNGDLLGIGFTENEELLNLLRTLRRARGTLPGPSHVNFVRRALPETREEFDGRNLAIFKNTGDIALQLAAAVPADSGFTIGHPLIASHPNHKLYTEIYPEGGSPVVYISHDIINQNEVAERLWASEAVREESSISQSFAFENARVFTTPDFKGVRIAGGAKTDAEAFGEACADALLPD